MCDVTYNQQRCGNGGGDSENALSATLNCISRARNPTESYRPEFNFACDHEHKMGAQSGGCDLKTKAEGSRGSPPHDLRAAERSGLALLFNGSLRGYSLQPDLAPIGVNAPRTEHTAIAIPGLANHGIKDDARVLEFLHLACFFMQYFGDTLEDAVRAATIGNHLGIEEQAAIPV